MSLNPKQERFCQEYIIDLNATQAAIRAGYSEKTARSIGQRLLTNVDIRARIEEMQAKRSRRTEISADFVLSGLKKCAIRCMEEEPVMKWDYEEKAMVQVKDDSGKGVWQFDSAGANRSFELLGKHLGIFEKDNSQRKPDTNVIIPEQVAKAIDKMLDDAV